MRASEAETMMRDHPTVGVVLPHYGCEPYLAQAVASILDQSYPHLELHVIDDASPDDRWLEALGSAPLDHRVRLYRTTRRVGPYRIKNALIPGLATPLLGFQDADDWSRPDRLEVQVDALRRWKAGIVGSRFAYVQPDGTRTLGRRMPRHANFFRLLGKQFLLLHPTSILRREVFDALGGFDGTTTFGADEEFLDRALPHFRVRNVPQVLYYYRRRAGSLTGSPATGLGSEARLVYEAANARRRTERGLHEWLSRRRRPAQAPANDVAFDLIPVPLP